MTGLRWTIVCARLGDMADKLEALETAIDLLAVNLANSSDGMVKRHKLYTDTVTGSRFGPSLEKYSRYSLDQKAAVWTEALRWVVNDLVHIIDSLGYLSDEAILGYIRDLYEASLKLDC